MINNALFSSNTDMWETPKDLFDKLDEEFEFQTDVCHQAKCKVQALLHPGAKRA